MNDDGHQGDGYQYRTGFHHGMDHARRILQNAKDLDDAKRLLSIYERVCRSYRSRMKEQIFQGSDGTRETLERGRSSDPYRGLPPRPSGN